MSVPDCSSFSEKQLLQNITEAGTTFRVFGEATKELKD